MNIILKCLKHFKVITKHKIEVMKACFKAGLYWQGITHDLSKYSIAEFVNSAKYFQGDSSPIDAEKIAKGYSYVWLHHRGRNPHHWEYWLDNFSKGTQPVKIPFKYCIEMICDWIGAGKVYSKDKWSIKEPEKFFVSKVKNKEIILHHKTESFIAVVLKVFSTMGFKGLDKKILKQFYKELC